MAKHFREVISRSKIEYMHCKFSQHEKGEVEMRLDVIALPKCKQLRHLRLFQENGVINEDVTHRVKTG